MNPFSYTLASQPDEAIRERTGSTRATYIAGGTNLLDHIKLGVEQPQRLVDVRKLGLDQIEALPGGGLRIGAMVRNTTLAYDERVRKNFPVLSEAILSGASPQLRNVATTAGNLLQRTRCYYFRDGISPCNKREPGSGCAAITGFNRIHAVLGTSEQCIATHPSDMDVAMMALDATVRLRSANRERTVPLHDFYVAYGDDPAKENVLEPGELITAIDLPATPWFARSHYFKARERASYEFALSSAAVAMDVRDGVIHDSRVALGGVATKPWRAHAAEKALKGEKPNEQTFLAAAQAELKSAVARSHNGFKIELCRRVLVQTLQTATALT
jgi:xanthine dehydrogenase YagS FAD-binding subunit